MVRLSGLMSYSLYLTSLRQLKLFKDVPDIFVEHDSHTLITTITRAQ
jgi:hypothetical protein